MRYELFLALRQLRARRKRRLARATAFIAVLGIAIGVASLLVALALGNGFRDEMRDKILRGTAHLTVARADGRAMSDYRVVAQRIAEIPGVKNASGTTYDGALVEGNSGVAYAVIRGIEQTSTEAIKDLSQLVTSGSIETLFKENENGLPAIALGSELATRIGVKPGEVIDLTVTQPGVGPARKSRVRVSGIVKTGLFEYDSTWIYASLDRASAFSGGTHTASMIAVQLDNIYDVKHVAAKIKETFGTEYTTIDWQEANRPLFTALALERRIGAIVIALIIVIAALNITTTLILVVLDRRRDIAILSAMGASRRGIMRIFVIEGAIVGAIGAVVGVALGLIAVVIANRYELVSLPADVYSISNVPLHTNVGDMLIAAVVALLLSIISTIYPARAAAKTKPADLLCNA